MEAVEGVLLLHSGKRFAGRLLASGAGTAAGEVVFNTAMTGYQEILTDPSYHGQIVVMAYPEIGNYGLAAQDAESRRPFSSALVVREISPVVSSWRAQESLQAGLQRAGIPLLAGVDTRSVVLALRDQGAQAGLIAPAGQPLEGLLRQLQAIPPMHGRNLAAEVSVAAPYAWPLPGQPAPGPAAEGPEAAPLRIIAYDFGVKYAQLRHLAALGATVEVVPYATPAEDVLAKKPSGVFLSNGPGDPEPMHLAIENVRKLLGRVPLFGVCLGHQVLGLALGGRSYKLKFGHHGANHPVMHLPSGRVEITSQNHGFAIAADSLPAGVKVTHINLNDQTVAGLESTADPAFSVQFHPEAAPGPHDSRYLFAQFVHRIRQFHAG